MNPTHRQYRTNDFELISEFLASHYQTGNTDGNWLQPAWEYMHSHPHLDEDSLAKIRIWKQTGEIVAVVHFESSLGEAFFQVHPAYHHLKSEMLEYAETYLLGQSEEGNRYLRAYVNDTDCKFRALVEKKGYLHVERFNRPVYSYDMPQPFPAIDLPDGFILKSLADENNLKKIHRVLWRGFNHQGEPPEEGIEGRKKMQSTPNFRPELTMVVEAPEGGFVSFCGMWYEKKNKIAYVEPVATDPDFRRMGLGKAAVMEGIRRCAELGATVAYVGSDQEFYKSMGFQKSFISDAWVKVF
jgi:GNAT superfamily N-acetyltransferase